MTWRPIEYTEKHLILAKEYLEQCKDEDRVRIKTEWDKSTSYDFWVIVKLPSIEGLARYLQRNWLHVARSTIYEWRDKFEEFSDILEQILSEQAERLINRGMNSDYNSTIAKLLMWKHWYTDKTEIEATHTISWVKNINVNVWNE